MEPAPAEVAARLRAILRSDEFQPRLSERIWVSVEDALRAFRFWLDGLGPATRLLVILVSLLILGALAMHLWRSFREAMGSERLAGGGAARDEPSVPSPGALLERARSLADAGLLRDASRALQEALLLQACRERNLPWRPSLSDWEWVGLLRPSEEIVEVTRTAQRMAFGRQPSRVEFDVCSHRVHELIGGRPGARADAP